MLGVRLDSLRPNCQQPSFWTRESWDRRARFVQNRRNLCHRRRERDACSSPQNFPYERLRRIWKCASVQGPSTRYS